MAWTGPNRIDVHNADDTSSGVALEMDPWLCDELFGLSTKQLWANHLLLHTLVSSLTAASRCELGNDPAPYYDSHVGKCCMLQITVGCEALGMKWLVDFEPGRDDSCLTVGAGL